VKKKIPNIKNVLRRKSRYLASGLSSGAAAAGTAASSADNSVSGGEASSSVARESNNSSNDGDDKLSGGPSNSGYHKQQSSGSSGSKDNRRQQRQQRKSHDTTKWVSKSLTEGGSTAASASASSQVRRKTVQCSTVEAPQSLASSAAAAASPCTNTTTTVRVLTKTGTSSPSAPHATPPLPSSSPPPNPPSRVSSDFNLTINQNNQNEGPEIDEAYETKVPLLEIIELPRGGVSVETQAVGHVQFGIPPETIKDSMRLGIAVPSVYIVPVDRFCREMGPALGVNLAEFEFPAYFNFFVQRKRCTLIVDSVDAERNIRRVFSETLLGPAQFRREKPLQNEEEDFAPDFPREARPDFQKELQHFRIMPNGEELVLETLLKFCHFESAPDSNFRDNLGAPPVDTKSSSSSLDGDVDGSSSSTRNVVVGGGTDNGNEDDDYDGANNDSNDHGAAGGSNNGSVEVQVVGNKGETTKVMLNNNGDDRKGRGEGGNATTTVTENGMKKKGPKRLTYSQIRWIGDVAKIYPSDAPDDQIAQNKTKRVEIFKMPSGTDYVLHDIDENNIIVGKARFSGNVRVSEGISVIGLDEDPKSDPLGDGEGKLSEDSSMMPVPPVMIPTFNPPSFGVTVLGNSHGFDKSGSTSGYVLWINGRGVMIDPPPYSSATLEREGIRPRTIVGIILTHCHADHDAGAFQKVLTGSPVVVITTPTIYKSFIRKYAALSSLSPALLRHSHRYKPAIIGEPLRFQGATFHFTYTLHTIPCVGFRVDWRGRSMVFTGDHFNNPLALQKLVEKGVLSKARCADLNHLPLQKTDMLLHEAGAPPIHTPLDVLIKLPPEVKARMYVVHTSALPAGCELRVAPTGTAGTIRLDQIRRGSNNFTGDFDIGGDQGEGAGVGGHVMSKKRPSIFESNSSSRSSFILRNSALLEDVDEYAEAELHHPTPKMYAHLLEDGGRASLRDERPSEPPPVSLRPNSSSDAWFTLNLLYAVPFMSSLSYAYTMEVLETARVVAFCHNEIVLSANRRSKYLVVVWEGTCMERMRTGGHRKSGGGGRSDGQASYLSQGSSGLDGEGKGKAVWYAGDWTGPRILQPEKRLSGVSSSSRTHDIVAMSTEGVKVIMVDFTNLHTILKNGSALYRKYHLSLSQKHTCKIPSTINPVAKTMFKNAVANLNIIELLEINSGLRKLTAVQKRHLECLVEGPTVYTPGQRLWRTGSIVDKAFIVVAGTVSFVPKRRHGGSVGKTLTKAQHRVKQTHETNSFMAAENMAESMKTDAVKAVRELKATLPTGEDNSIAEGSEGTEDSSAKKSQASDRPSSIANSMTETEEYQRLSRGLQKWAERNESQKADPDKRRRGSSSTDNSPEISLHDFCDATIATTNDEKDKKHVGVTFSSSEISSETQNEFGSSMTSVDNPQRPSKNRFANKVLGRLYNRRAFAQGLVFSRGHFLGDIEKMVEGLLAPTRNEADPNRDNYDEFDQQFGYGDNEDALSFDTMTIHELEGGQHTAHNSTLAAGKDGCIVLILPKLSLIPFLDAHPGLLLSLLGTQAIV